MNRLGCRYVTLDAATPRLVSWYERQEFVINKVDRKDQLKRAIDRKVHIDTLPTSMRFDLHHFLADLRERFPTDYPRE